MNCRDIEILLQLDADGEVTDSERVVLEAHFDECVACRRKEAWLEVLSEQFEAVYHDGKSDLSLADEVVEALGTLHASATPDEDSIGSTSSPTKKSTKKKAKKRSLIRRAVSNLWSRRTAKRAKTRAKNKKQSDRVDGGWVEASVSALQLPPTSLEGFRAAKSGVSSAVSGPVQAVKWAASAMPKKGK